MPTGVSILGFPGAWNNVDTQNVGFGLTGQMPPDIALDEQALNRRQQLANILLQRGMQSPQGEMAGRFYVPPSPVQGLAQLGYAGAGAYLTHKNDQTRAGLAGKSNAMLSDAMNAYRQQTAPQQVEAQGPGAPVPNGVAPGQGFTPEELQAPTINGTMQDSIQQLANSRSKAFYDEGPRPTNTTPKTPEDRQNAIVETLMMSQHPQARAIGQLLMQQEAAAQERQANRAFLSAEHEQNRTVTREGQASNMELRKATIEANALNTQALIDSKERMGQDANDLKKQLADQQTELKRMEIGARKDQLQAGKVPQGYRMKPDGTMEAISGGPADLKMQGALNTDIAMLQGSNAAFDRLATSANALLNHPGLAGITGLRGKIPNIPGSAAADADAQLQTLKSQIGFGVMQELRNNSKTGSSGLGALSDAEGKRLEQNLAALDKAQSIDQMKSSLKSILDYSQGAKDRLRDAFNLKHKNALPEASAPASSQPSGGLTPAEQEELNTLKKKYGR